MKIEEIWKDINDYEELYQISNLGNIKSLNRVLKDNRVWKERIMKPVKDKDGYFCVNLYKNNKTKRFKVHRLVAQAFIPNPDNLPCVNHKDEDKTNNNVENLEWCTHEYNSNYGTAIERMTKTLSNPVLQLMKDGSLVRVWPSVMEVERQLHFSNSYISACCRGKRHSAYGYKWRYVNER